MPAVRYVRGMRARGALAAATAVLAALTLASCASDDAGPGLGSSRAALDALRSLGESCPDYDVTEVAAVPYTTIRCGRLQMDWFADAKAYDAAWLADCAAVTSDGRASMADIVIVTGPDWVARGNGDQDMNAWPATVSAEEAAATLGGTRQTAADRCKTLGAWQD
jgi:hypothetical protein